MLFWSGISFLAGVVVGLIYIPAFFAEPPDFLVENPSRRYPTPQPQSTDVDPDDWWKTGGRPPWETGQ